jgi:hypothetical protein
VARGLIKGGCLSGADQDVGAGSGGPTVDRDDDRASSRHCARFITVVAESLAATDRPVPYRGIKAADER